MDLRRRHPELTRNALAAVRSEDLSYSWLDGARPTRERRITLNFENEYNLRVVPFGTDLAKSSAEGLFSRTGN
jgi:hypothetical protein